MTFCYLYPKASAEEIAKAIIRTCNISPDTDALSIDQFTEALPMSAGLKLVSILVIIVVGVGIFFLTKGTSEAWQQTCMKQCREKGKDFIVAPAGTVGKSIEGGSNSTEPPYQCTCVQRGTQPDGTREVPSKFNF